MSKSVFVKTYGCQMNVYDSGRMQDVLAPLGYAQAETAEEADLVILNTCHIREKAVEKVYSELGRYRDMKAVRGGNMTMAVAGCVGQAEGEEITRRMKSLRLGGISTVSERLSRNEPRSIGRKTYSKTAP